MVEVTFIKDGKKIKVTADENSSLLEIAQNNDIEMDSACGGNGVCTTCLVKVEDGKMSAVSEKEEMMGMDPENPEYRLGCQCNPMSDCTVEVAY